MKHIYIACSAIWVKDSHVYENQPKNITEGIVLCGLSHTTILYTISKLIIKLSKYDMICGFLTSDNRFVSRESAVEIAKKSGQIHDNTIINLLSEDLFK